MGQLPPTPYIDSYWVLPGHFLAGEYPAVRLSEDLTRIKLRLLLQAGVDTFFDLTQMGELPPYDPILLEEAGWLDKQVSHQRHPIRDFGIPTREEMDALLKALEGALAAGKHVYLHCWGGIGRTGTVVACYLVRQGSSGEKALRQLKELREACGILFPPSPESDAQREFVLQY
ncbi:MAG TPA: dual specificity protein phosphatase family protein [Anaerolineaceae bacterium]|nr:dual specificity protein phosphatase family protein [Anaerolineaceae bacterium]